MVVADEVCNLQFANLNFSNTRKLHLVAYYVLEGRNFGWCC